MTIAVLIQFLLVILLVVGVIALLRLWSVLGSVRVTLANLEITRQDATETLKRLDETVATADKLLREEVTPTLQVARATLANVEVTTRALAETTMSLRRITGKTATANDARQLITAGTVLAQAMARRRQVEAPKSSGKSLLSVVGAGLVGLFRRGKKASGRSAEAIPQAATPKALPPIPPVQANAHRRGRAASIAPAAREAGRKEAGRNEAVQQEAVRNGEELRR